MAPPALLSMALLQQQKQQPNHWNSPPQPQQSASSNHRNSNWWKPASSWQSGASSSWDWAETDDSWHEAAQSTVALKVVLPKHSAGPPPAPSPPQEMDPLQAQLEEQAAAAHADRNNWMHNIPGALRSEEYFSMLEIFSDGNSIEIWRVSSSGRRVKLSLHRLTVMATLQAYSPRVHRGSPRSLSQVLDQDCNEVILQPGASWHGCAFEQSAQC